MITWAENMRNHLLKGSVMQTVASTGLPGFYNLIDFPCRARTHAIQLFRSVQETRENFEWKRTVNECSPPPIGNDVKHAV